MNDEEFADINKPLEMKYSADFGLLDEDQIKFINEGFMELVLAENANEIFRMIMLDEMNHNSSSPSIETIFDYICREFETPGCAYLPSETFNVSKNDTLVNNDILKIYKANNKHIIENEYNINILSILALDLGNNSGHYGMIWIDKTNMMIYIFDSMQYYDEYDKLEISLYTQAFKQLATELFDGILELDFEIKILNVIGDKSRSVQFTGGFISDSYKNEFLKEFIGDRIFIDYDDINKKISESQNHFCYMWSIWMLVILNIFNFDENRISKIIEMIYMSDMNPLSVIKKFSYGVLVSTGLIKKLDPKYKEFFLHNFKKIIDVQYLFKINEEIFPVISNREIDSIDIDRVDGVKLEYLTYTLYFKDVDTLRESLYLSLE